MIRWHVRWPWPLFVALTIAYTALLGSLYFSEIRHFTPCLLCWYQRILMYPLVPLIAYAIFGRVPRLAYLILALAVVGQGVSMYHYLMQKTTWLTSATVCGTTGVSCGIMYIDWYGVITIPLLAMLAFMLVSLCMVLYLNGAGSDGPVPLTIGMAETGSVAVLLAAGLIVWLVVRTAAKPEVMVPEPAQVATATSQRELAGDATVLQAGQDLFAANCAVCHGQEGVGIPTLTPSLQASATVREFSETELEALIRKGIGQEDPLNQLGNVMPPSGAADLTDAELQAIITYLKADVAR